MSKGVIEPKVSHIRTLFWDLLKTWIGPVAVGAIAFLLYPFDWSTTLSAIAIALASVAMALRMRNLRRSRRPWRRWRIATIITGCTTLPWAATAPLLLGRQPLYLCESSKTDPTETFSEPIIANGRKVATLLFIADPIRKFSGFKHVPDWLAGRRLRRIQGFSDGQRQYYVMPLSTALRKSVPSISSSTEHEELLEIVYHGLNAGIGVTAVGGDVLIGISVGLSHGPVVVALNDASKPWAAIRMNGPEQDVFRYAARLDFALTAVDSGDYSTALALLEDAGLHAPTPLEKARSLAIMAQLTSVVLSDSIGALQALSLYNATYQARAVAVSASDYDKTDNQLSAWIKAELVGAFEPYGSAYPEAAKSLGLDQDSVRVAEALRFQKESGRPVANWKEIAPLFNAAKQGLRKFMTADNAQTWFDAERERLARLNAKALLEEAKQAAARGPQEARWFAETVAQTYAMGMADDKQRISAALRRAAEGCGEPWRSQFNDYLEAGTYLADLVQATSSNTAFQNEFSLKSANHFGLRSTAAIFRELVSMKSLQTAKSPTFRFDEPPPAVGWWTTEYLDWFIATTWSLINHSEGMCDRTSPVCEQVLMAKQPYICYDGSEKHRLFAPGIGFAVWMLLAQPKIDPWWDHAFYFGVGTHFVQWQSGLLKPVGTRLTGDR
jgi:hypothetical protein